MKEYNPFLSTPIAILIGAVIISASILVANGVLRFEKLPTGQTKISFVQPVAAANQALGAQQAAQPTDSPAPTKADVTNGHFPVKGDPNAKVTVVEFADFQCPFCERFFSDTEKQLLQNYVDTGKVKFAFRQYAFLGQESTWAAEAAECANEQNKFWDYHDYLYNHQGQENSGTFTKDKLEGFARDLGLNSAQFNSCLESDKYAQAVKDDMADGQKAGVNGTPASFVNGTLISGAQPFSVFQSAIDPLLK